MPTNVARLAAAIKALAKESNPSMVSARVSEIVDGVEELGRRIADLEKRIAALESKAA